MKNKPSKKNDLKLLSAIAKSISLGNYAFSIHCQERQLARGIADLDVLDILENKVGRGRKRNKGKDIYKEGNEDWNYCIEGKDIDGKKIRIIFSFNSEQMLLITVVRLGT